MAQTALQPLAARACSAPATTRHPFLPRFQVPISAPVRAVFQALMHPQDLANGYSLFRKQLRYSALQSLLQHPGLNELFLLYSPQASWICFLTELIVPS